MSKIILPDCYSVVYKLQTDHEQYIPRQWFLNFDKHRHDQEQQKS
jgi:hypothetical protein